MANFNKVILAGNLTRDPELRATPKGNTVAKFASNMNQTLTPVIQQRIPALKGQHIAPAGCTRTT